MAYVAYYEGMHESCILMERLAGRDLFQTIAMSKFHLTEAKCVVVIGQVEAGVASVQVLEALQYLHHIDIIHLDIKPNNIMFTRVLESSLHVKLIDFGLARDVGPKGRARCHMTSETSDTFQLTPDIGNSLVLGTVFTHSIPASHLSIASSEYAQEVNMHRK